MKKIILTTMLVCLIGQVIFSQAQTATVTGKVTNEKNEALPYVTIRAKTSKEATQTDARGKFSLKVASLPVVLLISATEYEEKEVSVTNSDEVAVSLVANEKTLGEVIIGTSGDSRLKGKLINAPVSYETVTKKDFNNSPSDPYGTVLAKKGLDVTVSSITYKTYSTRGFNGSGSSRVNQIMDGMDNQAPGLNFSVGNFVGLSDLDIESIEILPGASSALYGPGGMNGTIILNSKSPFSKNNSGLSLIVKNGITDVGKYQRDKVGGYYDYTLRWAKNFNNKFGFKIGAQYTQANDWLANDSTNYLRSGGSGKVVSGSRQTDPNYDGVNVYGDETSFNVHAMPTPIGPVDLWNLVGRGIKAAYPQLGPGIDAALRLTSAPLPISRTGYNEIDVIDPKTKNIKLNGALHYKFNKGTEAIIAGHYGTGNTVYTGNNRYAFKDIKIGQYKVELRNKNWFIRGYTTQENAGEAYSATVTSQYFNEAWKPSGTWYQQYAQNYLVPAATVWLQTYAQSGGSVAAADAAVVAANMNFHNMGRSAADQGRLIPGSAQFTHVFDSVRSVPIPKGGLFLEKSQMWMGEGQYNFNDKIKFAEVIIGGNVKKYILDSKGTVFIDTLEAIKINEMGAYAQITKKLFSDKLSIGVSGRYDKNENFKGKFTPRVTALVNLGEGHNLRFSYQTAYKFPTTQQQWIRLNVGNVMLLGGLPWVTDFMDTKELPTYVYNPPAPSAPYTYKELKPESMRSFEAGYKGYINKKLLIDMYAYFGKYTDFLGRIVLVQPTNNNKLYSVVTNSETEVNTWGAGIGFDYKMAKNYFSFFNAYTDNLTNVPTGFQAGFSTPKYRLNAGFGNSGFGKKQNLGFNINLRWQDDFYWESGGLADGNVKAYTTLDAQVNYKLPKIKSMIKLGGTNITNKFYQTGFGNPYIGGMYYISFAYNIL
ncbi:MAG TPA: TonB-dependent receptor [Chitinophagaceae bacterium]|nr:TonB-dependent receptor [Chitinophagaceae bacterium]